MTLKKILSYILSATLLIMAIVPITAFAEGAEIDTELEGFVTEVVDGGFLMDDKDMGEVMVNTGDTTVYDGIVADGVVEVGQYLIVSYSGRLTRSLPPQAYADRVVSFKLEGSIGEVFGDKFLLTGDEQWGDVIVHVGANSPHTLTGAPVTVYFDGIMAMSMPGQVSARIIIVPMISGTVSEKNDEGFLVTKEDGEIYQVLLGEDTVATESYCLVEASGEEFNEDATEAPAALAEVNAAEATQEPEADEVNAVDIPEATEDHIPTQEDVEAGLIAIQPPIEINDGDVVTVYYNGITTKSIPAQLTAMEIVVLRDAEDTSN